MNIVQVSAELAPWSKTGGLGDVCGALPVALAGRGHRVVAIAPRYKDYEGAWDTGVRARVHLFGHSHEVAYYHLERGGVHHLFVDHPSFRRPGIYGDDRGVYGDNLFRFALLTRAALEAPLRVPLSGELLGEDVVFHANDWHTGLLPLYLEAVYRSAGRYPKTPAVLAIHNAGHHGTFDAHEFAGLDVSTRWWPAADMGGRLNCMKAGLVLASKLVTVSPTYARQLCQDQAFGLEGLFAHRAHDLWGILNGIGEEWNPATDRHLEHLFSADDLAGKALQKAALQRELGLPARPEVPLFGVVARLDHQKGIDLLMGAAPWLLRQDVQLVVLGSGGAAYEDFVRRLAREAPHRARGIVGFSEPLAHRIEAGADVFLMPSRFEPCGLNQLYSMRYGTVPIVHATGGLADTVPTWDPASGRGAGWAFREFTTDAFVQAIGWALHTWWHHRDAWAAIQQNGMRRDSGWDRAAELYERLYQSSYGG
jgi:starch synthase